MISIVEKVMITKKELEDAIPPTQTLSNGYKLEVYESGAINIDNGSTLCEYKKSLFFEIDIAKELIKALQKWVEVSDDS